MRLKRTATSLGLALALTSGATSEAQAPAPDVIEAAGAAGQFTMLLKAVRQAGLEGKMKAPGPYTVFAPTDAAFAAMPPATAKRLMDPANKKELAAVLSYHVLPGRLNKADVQGKNAEVKALTGQALVVDGRTSSTTVNGVRISTADMQVSNGVVHVVDEVLLPPTPVLPKL
jgi:uncharacterized surface protein with fasciclin (FAS1) repeats